MPDTLADRIADAADRIRPHVIETPLVRSSTLSDLTGADVWLKCENLQVTGSFKVRGATNHLLTLPEAQRSRGAVAASSGNHGIAVAHAGRALGIAVSVYVPEQASPAKIAAMRRLGANVVRFGTDGLDTEQEARRVALAEERPYVSPYNDLAIVAGQGTVGVELGRQLEGIGSVIVAVGGGGLVGGIASYLKRHNPAVRIIGAQPVNSRVMAESVAAGRVVEIPSLPTLSDGTAGGIEGDTVTFALCRDLVDEWVDVPEDEIARAMRHVIEAEHMLIEGSAAVAVATVTKMRTTPGERVAIVLCGANISAEKLKSAL
jgi:threonine dehydratase